MAHQPPDFVTSDVEITYSTNEKIGLPNYSNVSLLGSAKCSVKPGFENEGYTYLSEIVNAQMGQKRSMVLAAVGAWTNSQA